MRKNLCKGLRPILGLVSVVFINLAASAYALTVEQEVNAAYLREHPKEFAVEVKQGKGGLVDFKIKHFVPQRMYHVARLMIYHQGKLIADSSTPSYGKKGENTFWVSITPEDIAGSRFELSDSALAGEGDEAVPVVGTIIYKFRLSDFVPPQMPKPAPIP